MAASNSIGQLQIEISASSDAAARNIRALSESLRDLRKSLPTATNSNKIKEFSDSVKSIDNEAANKLNRLAKALERLSALGKARIPKDLGDNLRNVTLSVQFISDDAIARLDSMTRSLQRLANVDLKNVSSSLRGIKPEISTPQQPLVPQEAAVETSSVDTATEKVKELVREKEKLEEKTKLRIDAKDADKAKSKVGSLWNSLKRVAFYMAVRTALKILSDAFKEGLENAYEYTKVMGGDLAPALDRISSASLKLKNQLGAALSELITAIEPFVTWLLNGLAEIAKWLTKIFAMISAVVNGEKTYLVANDVEKSWKDADKAAKEYKRTLIGIDEINRLNAEPESEPKISDMFHEEQLPDWVKLRDFAFPLTSMKDLKESMPSEDDFIVWGNGFDELFNKITKIPPLLDSGGASAIKFENAFNDLIDAIKKLPIPTIMIPVVFGNPVTLFQSLLNSLRNYASSGINIPVIVGDPLPQLEAVYKAVQQFAHLFIQVAFKIANPIPEIQALYNKIMSYTPMTLEIAIKTPDVKPIVDAISQVPKAIWTAAQAIAAASIVISLSYGGGIAAVVTETAIGVAAISASYVGMQKAIEGAVLGSTLALSGLTAQTQLCFPIMQQQLLLTGSVIEVFGVALDNGTKKLEKFINTVNQLKSITIDIPALLSLQSSKKIGVYGGGRGGGFALPGYASGGFPEDGLFMANHNEMIGAFTNGRTAVANNDQIVEGISEGVSWANAGVIGAINQLIAVVQQIDPTIELDGLTVSRQLHRYNRQVSKEAGGSLVVEAMA